MSAGGSGAGRRGTTAQRQRARERARRPRPKAGELTTFKTGDPTEDARQDSITAAMTTAERRVIAAQDRAARDQYRAGRKAGQAARARTGRGPAAKAGRKVQRAARHPVTATRSGSWTGLAVGSLGLILLFNFLTAAKDLAGLLGGIQRGIRWLADPHAVIPYRK